MNAASIDPVDTSQTQTDQNDFPSNEGRPDNAMASAGDFTIVGYSSDEAMTDFTSGNSSITKGSVFEQGSADQTCIVNEELALYNDLEIGDVITLSNPNDEEETYELTISGIRFIVFHDGKNVSSRGCSEPDLRQCADAAVCYFSFTDCRRQCGARHVKWNICFCRQR